MKYVYALLLTGCLFSKQNAKTALDLATVLCIVAHAESDDPTVQQVCAVTNALLPDMKRLLGEQREAARRFAAEHAATCRSSSSVVDGGTDAAKR